MVGLPVEARLLEQVGVRLIETEADRRRHDEFLERHHYLHNANAVGQVLRYVVEYRGEWVAVLTFCSAALHLKPRDRFLKWTARQVCERRHLIAQNNRFLVLPATGRWPNLASRALKLVCQRIAGDWQPSLDTRYYWWRRLLIRTDFGARVTKPQVGKRWARRKVMSAADRISTSIPSIPRSCGCGHWEPKRWRNWARGNRRPS